ncbi:MAG: hypothetical protein WBP64_04905 [Nitrososphaeraceae archaeon]|jgi:hypothetical protein
MAKNDPDINIRNYDSRDNDKVIQLVSGIVISPDGKNFHKTNVRVLTIHVRD